MSEPRRDDRAKTIFGRVKNGGILPLFLDESARSQKIVT
jgi:hypothetical protein